MPVEITHDILASDGSAPPCVAAIGTFDGVHVGHRRVLAHAASRARDLGLTAVAVTFEPHPMEFLAPPGPGRLCTREEKYALMGACGIDRVAVLPFDEATASWTAEEFVGHVLRARLQARDVVVGFNFTCGRGGAADAGALAAVCRAREIQVHVVPPVDVDGEVASSSAVRDHLRQGRVERVAQLLDRPYALGGRVVPGSGRGRKLGFPTANLALPMGGRVVPARGVYRGVGRLGRETFPALIYIGSRPTFEHQAAPILEVHLVGYEEGPLRGRDLEVAFSRRLRAERVFASPEELAAQIQRDLADDDSSLEACGSGCGRAGGGP